MSAIIRGADLDLLETPGGNFSASLASAGRGATEVNIVLQQQEPVVEIPATPTTARKCWYCAGAV